MKQKKIISLLLALVLLLPCLPTAALAGPSTNYELTGRGEDDVVAVARAQVGRTGRDLGYTYEWCAAFVTWAGRTAGQNFPASDLYTPLDVARWFINSGAGAFYCFRDANFQMLQSGVTSKNAIPTTRSAVVPAKGDLVCFLWSHDIEEGYNWSHIGIVTEDYDGSGILHTVEGNTGTMDTLEQRSVMLRDRAYDNTVVGVIHPFYRAPGRTVNHYVEQYGGGYALLESETVIPTGKTFTVEDALGALHSYDGYGQPELWDLLASVRQEGDLNLYYPRLYTLTVTAGSGVTGVTGSGQYTAGTEVTITAQAAPGSQLTWMGMYNLRENNGTLILTMPALDILLEVNAEEVPHVGPFLDVGPDTWYAAPVAKVYELGLMKGTSESAFSPLQGVTLAEAVVLASRLHSESAGDEADFAALEGKPWYAPYAAYALEQGLITEEPDYGAAATRADLTRILAKALPAETLEPLGGMPEFADLEGDSDFAGEIELLCRAGIISGETVDGKQYFRPQRPISRAEVATLAARMADPSLRLKPAEPVESAEPVQPEEPAESAEPVQPEEPAESAEPVQPEEPAAPSEPSESTEPSEPSEPAEPSESAEPAES